MVKKRESTEFYSTPPYRAPHGAPWNPNRFASFIENLETPLRRMIEGKLQGDSPEDVLQETCARLLLAARAGKPIHPGTAFRTASHIITDWFRKGENRYTIPTDMTASPRIFGCTAADTVPEIIEKRHTVSLLRKAITNLSKEHWQVIQLRFFTGLSVAEISREMGIPQGTVKSQLHRAVGILKNCLKDEMGLD